MEIISEQEEKESFYNMDIDMSIEEIEMLVWHYDNNCPEDVKQNLKINWAINDVLRQQVEKKKKELEEDVLEK